MDLCTTGQRRVSVKHVCKHKTKASPRPFPNQADPSTIPEDLHHVDAEQNASQVTTSRGKKKTKKRKEKRKAVRQKNVIAHTTRHPAADIPSSAIIRPPRRGVVCRLLCVL